jgi:hypothetical protein
MIKKDNEPRISGLNFVDPIDSQATEQWNRGALGVLGSWGETLRASSGVCRIPK